MQPSPGWPGSGTALFGPDIAPCEPAAERDDYAQVLLLRRLRDALAA